MGLSKEAIKEFKEIYYKEFQERISDEEAQELGESLISLFKIIYRSIPKNNKQNPKDNKDLE
jgi:flagellin-specific chaperone FliS